MYECLKEQHVVTIVCEQAHKAEHKRNLIGKQSAFWGVKEKEGACGHSLMLSGFIKRMSTCPLPSVLLFSLEATWEPPDRLDLTENLLNNCV